MRALKPSDEQTESAAKNNPVLHFFISNLYDKNPVLVRGLGLTLVIGAGNTLLKGVILSGLTIVVLILTSLFAFSTGKKMPQTYKAPTYVLFASALLVPVLMLMPLWLSASLGFFIPLIALNALTIVSFKKATTHDTVRHVFLDSLSSGVSFSFVMIFVSIVREAFGYGTLWGIPIPLLITNNSDVIAAVPGGFIIVGFLAGMIQYIKLKTEGAKD